MMTALLMSFFYCLSPSPACDRMIERLGHDRFSVREQAADKIRKMGTAAKPGVMTAIRTSRCPETVARCRTILNEIAKEEANGLNPMPYIDAQWFDVQKKSYEPGDKHAVAQAYLAKIGPDGRPWNNYRWATWEWTKDLLAKGASPTFLRIVLAAMHARDEVFIGTSPPMPREANPPVVVDWQEYMAQGKP